jgi:hypothetical protein
MMHTGHCWQHSGKVKTALYGKGVFNKFITFLVVN